MQRGVKWTVAAVVVLGLVAAVAAVLGVQLAEHKRQRHVVLKLAPERWESTLASADAATLARGKYLFNSRGCADCHGATGAGHEFINDGKGLRLKSPDISPGEGGVVARYTPEDWVRTVRHGVKPDGRPVFFMPSEDYNQFTQDDLGALVAYVRSLPPASGSAAQIEVSLPIKLLYGYGAIQDAAHKIDHSRLPPQSVPEGVTAAHGAYVANMCLSCHGPGLSGGKIPGTPPDWAPAANLTPGPGSALKRYPTAEQFVAMLRSGKRPDGTAISVMPFKSLGRLSDVDARALYVYLQTVPPKRAGQR